MWNGLKIVRNPSVSLSSILHKNKKAEQYKMMKKQDTFVYVLYVLVGGF